MGSDDLVNGIRSGNEDAAAVFDRRFRARIEAIAHRRGISEADAEDVAQDVLVDAIRQIQAGRFHQRSTLSTWIYAIAARKIADHWRKHSAWVRANTLGGALESTRPDSSELIAIVKQALGRLPPEARFVLLMHDDEGHTLAEIGRLLVLGKSAVWDRLEHARSDFAAEVTGDGRHARPKRLKGE